MFSKKCMVVGSLLVMAAQTATAVTCASVDGSSTPTLADLCASPTYTGDLVESPASEGCDNDPCSGGDATLCCVARSTCSGMAGLVDTICGQNGYSGEYVDNPGTVKCAGATCDNNDASTCCKPAALCDTISAPTTFCGSDSEYVQPGTLIGGAFCKLLACTTSGDTSIDEARCCVAKANCRTFSASDCTAGDTYTGALKPDSDSDRCAGATCVSGDAAACCSEKATCDSLNDAGASPNLATVCGNDPAYSGAVNAGFAYKCATATCQTSDAAACCKPATAKCNSITAAGSTTTICGASGLDSAKANSDCSGGTCGLVDKDTCCNAVTTCTSDYDKGDNMVASGAGTAKGATITFTCDSGYAATKNGVATCQDDGDWEGGECQVLCSVTDGSKATPWTGGKAEYEECTCTGAGACTTLNVCDVAKKTCVCTPGKDHWCYEDTGASYAVKFGCFAQGDNKFKGWKCVGDNVLEAKYSDATCDTHIAPAAGGEDKTFTATKTTMVEGNDNGTNIVVKTEEKTTLTGISTCKGGVAGAGAAPPGAAAPGPAPGAAAPGPAPGAAAPGPSGDAEFDAGSVAQCSTLAMLMVVAAMWAGRN